MARVTQTTVTQNSTQPNSTQIERMRPYSASIIHHVKAPMNPHPPETHIVVRSQLNFNNHNQ